MTAILDPAPLGQLGEDVGPDAARAFATTYAAMLTGRLERIHTSVATGDVDEAYVAALSLQSASAMVGAHALAEIAAGVAAALRRCELAPALRACRWLATLAAPTRLALAAAGAIAHDGTGRRR